MTDRNKQKKIQVLMSSSCRYLGAGLLVMLKFQGFRRFSRL